MSDALEKSLQSIENHVAEIVGSLEKLRTTNHELVGKLTMVQDLANQVETMSENLKQLNVAVGVLSDTVKEVDGHWKEAFYGLTKRVGALEAHGKRV